MYAQVHTEVEGASTAELSDAYVMGNGGGVLHYLERPANGDYKVTGQVLTGYPQEWGFDGYFGVSCPLWTGSIKNEPAADEAVNDDGAAGVLAVALKTATPIACNGAAAAQCTAVANKPGAPAGPVTTTPAAPGEVKPELTLTTSVTGIVQSIGPDTLVLITDAGRYVTLTLPARPSITRHTYVTLDELAPDSVVGAVLGKSAKNEIEVVHLRQYRNESKAAALASESASTDQPGREVRGLLKAITHGAKGNSMRLAQAKGEANLPVAADAFATLIDSAQLSDLKPFSGRARVIAQQRKDGTLLVTQIDILQ
jgi:hypothetical protein